MRHHTKNPEERAWHIVERIARSCNSAEEYFKTLDEWPSLSSEFKEQYVDADSVGDDSCSTLN